MKGYKSIHVDGCDMCNIFTQRKFSNKIYYPEYDKIAEEDDFVILECLVCNKPIVIVSDHTTEIGKEQWGRILYRCKELFGGGIRLNTRRTTNKDHWHAHIDGISRDKYKLPNLKK